MLINKIRLLVQAFSFDFNLWRAYRHQSWICFAFACPLMLQAVVVIVFLMFLQKSLES